MRNLLIGIFSAWLSLTPEGKKFKQLVIERMKEMYLRNEEKVGENGGDNGGNEA